MHRNRTVAIIIPSSLYQKAIKGCCLDFHFFDCAISIQLEMLIEKSLNNPYL
ncbi:MAG: hypothetical protein GY757_18600 [bacterium]|nr:hypothetical protein [bacterium]